MYYIFKNGARALLNQMLAIDYYFIIEVSNNSFKTIDTSLIMTVCSIGAVMILSFLFMPHFYTLATAQT